MDVAEVSFSLIIVFGASVVGFMLGLSGKAFVDMISPKPTNKRFTCDWDQNWSYDPIGKTWTIYGTKYSDALFQAWGKDGLPVGTLFELVKREDATIHIKKILGEGYGYGLLKQTLQ